MRTYIVEVADALAYLSGDASVVWRVIGYADSFRDANDLEDEAKRNHPGKVVRVRVKKERADVDG